MIEDTRKERGDYDDFFRIAKPSHDGSLEERIARLEHQLREYRHLLDVLTRALLDKGVLTAEMIEQQRAFLAGRGAWHGARIVAHAWVDAAYKQRLLANGGAAIAELGLVGRGEEIVVLENTPKIRNLVVCTLCSCYPWSVLGLPPVWYKSAPYRSRAVIDPRGVLKELGGEIPDDVELRVWDSTAEIRYLVLPERPAGTDGWTEEQLATLVTRDAMIGTGLPKPAHGQP